MGRFHCHPSMCGRKQNYKSNVWGFDAGRRHSWYGHIVVKQGYVSYQRLVERSNCTCGVSLASSVSFMSSDECAMHHPAFTTLHSVLPCKIPGSATSIQKYSNKRYSNKATATQKCVFWYRMKPLASWIFKAKSRSFYIWFVDVTDARGDSVIDGDCCCLFVGNCDVERVKALPL